MAEKVWRSAAAMGADLEPRWNKGHELSAKSILSNREFSAFGSRLGSRGAARPATGTRLGAADLLQMVCPAHQALAGAGCCRRHWNSAECSNGAALVGSISVNLTLRLDRWQEAARSQSSETT